MEPAAEARRDVDLSIEQRGLGGRDGILKRCPSNARRPLSF
jgi:hypothetical protein